MQDQINVELIKLQEELSLLDSAVKHIEKAGEISSSVIESVKSVQSQYGEYLKKIAAKYEEYLENTRVYNAEKINELSDSHKEQINEVQKLIDSYKELAEATSKLPEQIEGVNFPSRLDNIEASISNINQQMTATQKQVNGLELKIENEAEKSTEIARQMTRYNNQLSTVKVFTILLFILMLGVFAINFVPFLLE
jgi:chromosome segregation ATPase